MFFIPLFDSSHGDETDLECSSDDNVFVVVLSPKASEGLQFFGPGSDTAHKLHALPEGVSGSREVGEMHVCTAV